MATVRVAHLRNPMKAVEAVTATVMKREDQLPSRLDAVQTITGQLVFVGTMTQYQAEPLCVAQGAVLYGLQNDDERMRMAAVYLKLMHQHGFDQ
ncbi:hypothetical protein L3Y34_009589 [Caenorhabditis briggsae]|uniref:Uncharacterized protein n=1 Tax=Caenorhabditis briggsae TaxID=6238 RepID=A0AAE9AAI6_CAEBR|nr:hypothetical protein L3Y34_009589 [Caenorhabditis briggsae]